MSVTKQSREMVRDYLDIKSSLRFSSPQVVKVANDDADDDVLVLESDDVDSIRVGDLKFTSEINNNPGKSINH